MRASSPSLGAAPAWELPAVLDVGCGRGAALVPLAAAAGPTGSALGIDVSERVVS